MMYGFGDEEDPNPKTVELMEKFVVDFVVAMTKESSKVTNRNKIKVEDLFFVLRNHPKMYARAEEFVKKNKQIEKEKKITEPKGLSNLSNLEDLL